MFKEYFVKREAHVNIVKIVFFCEPDPTGQLKVLYEDKLKTAWNIDMQWLYLIGQGTVSTHVYFHCAALQQSARGYNARTHSQSKTDVSVQSVCKFIF